MVTGVILTATLKSSHEAGVAGVDEYFVVAAIGLDSCFDDQRGLSFAGPRSVGWISDSQHNIDLMSLMTAAIGYQVFPSSRRVSHQLQNQPDQSPG
jgi:hypothetical protein